MAQSTMRALQAHPQGRAVLEPMESLALFSMQNTGSEWLAAPQTARAAELLSRDPGRRTLQLLDAFTALGEGRTNPMRMRSFAIAESPQQLLAHRVVSGLHGSDHLSMIGAARDVDEAIASAAQQSPTVRGHWIGGRGVDAVALFPDRDGSALVPYLLTGDTERAPARLAVELLNARHEGEHALAGHPTPTMIPRDSRWHEEGAAQLIADAPVARDAFLRDAAGLTDLAPADAAALTKYGASIYLEERLVLGAALRQASIDPQDPAHHARMVELLQGGPFTERLDRVAAAVAQQHPSADAAEIRAALDWAGSNGGTRQRAGLPPFPNGTDELHRVLGVPRHADDPGPWPSR